MGNLDAAHHQPTTLDQAVNVVPDADADCIDH